jgi:hypothetical protein
MINTNYKIPTHGSPSSSNIFLFGLPTRASSNILKIISSMFGPDHDDANDNKNMNTNLIYTPQKSGGISTRHTGIIGGTKRKHKNKSKKTRKNKSNKKRVKLISKK